MIRAKGRHWDAVGLRVFVSGDRLVVGASQHMPWAKAMGREPIVDHNLRMQALYAFEYICPASPLRIPSMLVRFAQKYAIEGKATGIVTPNGEKR